MQNQFFRKLQEHERVAEELAHKHLPSAGVECITPIAVMYRLRDKLIETELKLRLAEQSQNYVKRMIEKGASSQDVLNFLNTPKA
jgi:hypothetical protein